jgi:hypothetical protein
VRENNIKKKKERVRGGIKGNKKETERCRKRKRERGIDR